MQKNKYLFSVLSVVVAGVVVAAPPVNPDWPKGIDPGTLLLNEDAEPDLEAPGFVDIFNGEDLSGWSILGSQMKFGVDEGAIVGTCVPGMKPNSFLCTDKTYRDFIFTAEFKWDVLGNSGIMFRASAREPNENGIRRVFGYQSEMDQNERRWTGGIYGEGMGAWKVPLSKPEGHAAARGAITDRMAWNRMTIYANGNVMKTWINGIPCAHLVNDERSEGFFGLQVHAGKQGTIRWRSIRVKELTTDTAWTDLFADGTFAQWEMPAGGDVKPGWRIEDGIVHRVERAGSIVTRAQYEDFELAFEWKISALGNSGVKYRVKKGLGLEYQVLDDANSKAGAKPNHRAGAIYDLLAAPDDKPVKPVGEWNFARVVAKGPILEHWLNGVRVAHLDQSTDDWQERFEKSKYKEREGFGIGAGSILLQDHGSEVWFRNVRIRDLKTR